MRNDGFDTSPIIYNPPACNPMEWKSTSTKLCTDFLGCSDGTTLLSVTMVTGQSMVRPLRSFSNTVLPLVPLSFAKLWIRWIRMLLISVLQGFGNTYLRYTRSIPLMWIFLLFLLHHSTVPQPCGILRSRKPRNLREDDGGFHTVRRL